jgi:hypothetical protein
VFSPSACFAMRKFSDSIMSSADCDGNAGRA